MTYKIIVVKDKRFEQAFQFALKKVGENNKCLIFECEGDLWMSPEVLGMSQRQFLEFYKRLRVIDGRKKLEHGQIHLYPVRRHVLSVRLHSAEYLYLKKIVPDGETPSTFVRSLLLDKLREYVYNKKQSHQSRLSEVL